MYKTVIAMISMLAACATDGGDDVVGDDEPPPPFTNGVSTLSGAADAGYADGPRGVARFANPVNVAFGPDGRLYVADFDNSMIRVVDMEGTANTVIAQPEFKRPFAMTFAADGTLYVTTDRNTTDASQGPMTGSLWRIDNGVATVVAENVGRPRGIVALPDGRLAFSDYQHHVIQLVNPTTGAVTALAGTWDAGGMLDGVGAKFSVPYGLGLRDGKLVVADHMNHRIRLIGLDGTVETLAGGTAGFADGPLASARFNFPQGIAVTASGDIYVSDLGNYRIRRIRGDVVETIAGSGEGGYLDSDDRLASQLYGMEGVAVNASGAMVFVADGGRGEDLPFNRVRSIKME